jgi:WXG100 family type VII secretion target
MTNIDSTPIVVQDELASAGPTLNSSAETISGELAALLKQLEPVVDTWTGAAARNWEVLQHEWNAAAGGLLGPDGVLGFIAQALNITWINYCNAEGANADTWQIS